MLRIRETYRPRTSTETITVSDKKRSEELTLPYTCELENGLNITVRKYGFVTITNFVLVRGDSAIVSNPNLDKPLEKLNTPFRALKNFFKLPTEETIRLYPSDILRVRTLTPDKEITLTISN